MYGQRETQTFCTLLERPTNTRLKQDSIFSLTTLRLYKQQRLSTSNEKTFTYAVFTINSPFHIKSKKKEQ